MADTNQQQTGTGINDESAWKAEKGGWGKVACPLYLFWRRRMADTNQQRTWFGINDESAWKTEKGERGKVACPLYRFLYLSRNDALFGGGGNDLIVGGGDVNFADNYAAASERLVV